VRILKTLSREEIKSVTQLLILQDLGRGNISTATRHLSNTQAQYSIITGRASGLEDCGWKFGVRKENAMNGSAKKPARALPAIFWGGLLCGVLDISSALVAHGFRGVKPIRILQSVASGLLGADSYKGGWRTALLGTALHFLIAFTAATVFYLASRKIAWLTEHAVLSGFAYAEVVYLFMNFVVIPLSLAHRAPLSIASLVTGPVGHLFFVGLPISLAVRRYSR
jgi:hypothetical protein